MSTENQKPCRLYVFLLLLVGAGKWWLYYEIDVTPCTTVITAVQSHLEMQYGRQHYVAVQPARRRSG